MMTDKEYAQRLAEDIRSNGPLAAWADNEAHVQRIEAGLRDLGLESHGKIKWILKEK